MQARKTIIFSLLLACGALLMPATASTVIIVDEGGGGGGPYIPPGKVEQSVLDNVNILGTSDFFIWMTTKADLSAAAALQTKEEKGQFVYNALVQTAEATQASVRAYLAGMGVAYQPYYIANKILVKGGTLAVVADVANRPDVTMITADHPFQLQEPFIPGGPPPGVLSIEPNISFVKANQVWSRGWNGQGTVLAGNDTGLDEDHPAIKSHYRGCLNPPTCTTKDHNYNWWDATRTYPTDPYDGHGHGTHTAGTMVGDDGAGNQIGMAPGAKTIHCKNMTNGGSGSDATFTECFQWDLAPWDLNRLNPRPDKAPDAINNSWGYWGGNAPQFEDEIAALQAAGVVVEVSAGNEGSSCWSLRSPGDYRQVLTTGSVNHSGGALPGTLTGFSSRGPSDLYPSDRDIPDVMAPGESIRSSLPGGSYAYWSGTSMAGPHVTGLVGLMWSANPGLRGRVAETVQIMRDTAVRLSGQLGSSCGGNYTTGPNNDWGYGTIDALAAANATRSNTCWVDLVANTSNCYLVPAISFTVPPGGGKTVMKLNLNPAQTTYGRAVFDTLYGGAPSGWTVNIGDSSTNNGFGGDAATQSNDAEMQVYGTTMSVYGSDRTPASVRNILNIFNLPSQGTTLSFDVSNYFLGWVRGELRSDYIYALQGQSDTEGPVNWDIYAGFNRTISDASRSGTGVTRVTVTLSAPPASGGSGGGGGSPIFVKQEQATN